MKVLVIGGGHIGSTLAGYLSKFGKFDKVSLLTSKPEEFSKKLIVNDVEHKLSYESHIDEITNNFKEGLDDVDIVMITYPHFMIEDTLIKIKPYLKAGAFVGIIPGSGGCEFFWKKHFDDRWTLFGFQRVPFTAKYAIYGKETNLKSWKPSVTIAAIPTSRTIEVCQIIDRYCNFKSVAASNFLAITLTPSNPVLHTSRTYDIYYKHDPHTVFPEKGYYYKDWTDHASQILFGIDGELQSIIKELDKIDLSAVKPLGIHYEAPTIEAMTKKISTIPTFQSVMTARLPKENGYVADTKSRYFTEDYPWGLCIIKGFAEITGVKTPTIDKVLKWYAEFMGLEYFIEDKFIGKDLSNTGIPQNYGLTTIHDIYTFYLNDKG